MQENKAGKKEIKYNEKIDLCERVVPQTAGNKMEITSTVQQLSLWSKHLGSWENTRVAGKPLIEEWTLILSVDWMT